MKHYVLTAAVALAATPAVADYERMQAQGTVAEAMERLTEAVEGAGATIFATVDHGAGAGEAGMELNDSQLLIFGNPQLGTPVMQEDMMAGLHLPLKMLVYSDGTQTWIAYEEVEDMLDDLDVDDDLPVLEQMEGALANFARAAAGQ